MRELIEAFLCDPIGHVQVYKTIPLRILWSTAW